MHGSFSASIVLCSELIFFQRMEEITISMFCFTFCTTFNFPVHAVIIRTVVSTLTHSLCVLDGSEMRMPTHHWREKLVLAVSDFVIQICQNDTQQGNK